MAEISRTALFGKLNALGYKAIESATVFCKIRGNPYVEMVHWLHQILQLPDSDLHRIIKAFNIEPSRLATDITDALDRLPRGSTSISDLSSHIEETVERGWIIATLMFGDSQVRSGHLITGMLQIRSLKSALLNISSEFSKISLDTLTTRFQEVVDGSPEERMHAQDGFQVGGGVAPGTASGSMAPAQMGKQEALAQFTVDMTEQARNSELDPIVGRDSEIRQIIDILMRRRQNNPILTGEAGVGKTAVVEGFAQRIACGDVPPALRDVTLRSLDVGLLQAGASMKGEFENRLKQVIEEVQSSERPIILFIDEAHTLVGAGGAAGTGDAANLLKPALARGNLRTVAATTWAEYKKHIEKDPALTRRFQMVQVFEPSEEKAMQMMRGMISTMEQHHRVQILDKALEAAVRLSHRYIPARQLPDKSVSLLDTAAARVAISQHDVPPEVDDIRKKIQALDTERAITLREQEMGIDIGTRLVRVDQALDQQHSALSTLEQRWSQEKILVDDILALRAQLRDENHPQQQAPAAAETADVTDMTQEPDTHAAGTTDNADKAETLQRLSALQEQLRELQGESPLILPTVDDQAVAAVVQDW
ncbi:MAG: AAA family ATPase, partial [Motiliproteus sp.]